MKHFLAIALRYFSPQLLEIRPLTHIAPLLQLPQLLLQPNLPFKSLQLWREAHSLHISKRLSMAMSPMILNKPQHAPSRIPSYCVRVRLRVLQYPWAPRVLIWVLLKLLTQLPRRMPSSVVSPLMRAILYTGRTRMSSSRTSWAGSTLKPILKPSQIKNHSSQFSSLS
jgi:hypothetical protein